MPAKKTARPTHERTQTAADEGPSKGSEDASVTGSSAPERAAEDVSAAGGAEPAGRVRRTQRTIHRHSVDEEIVETIVEDLPAPYSPPASDYPATVG